MFDGFLFLVVFLNIPSPTVLKVSAL
jgi:hypothetical protein